MLHNRQGSVAFATVIALVPLIGVIALGAEAGSWYVTKQHAQNAADAAAYSGALRLACSLSGSNSCDTTQDYVYRGKQFAAQNSFCNTGDSSYPGSHCASSLPAGMSQAVQIDQPTSRSVRAVVSQQQPAYLAKLLGLSTVSIGATAVAEVDTLAKPPCVLALTDPITFQGSPTVSSPNCGISSNSTAPNAIGFTGNNGIQLDAPSYTVGGCSQTGGSQCTDVQTYQQPVPDPLSGLDTAMKKLATSDFPNGSCKTTPTSYEAGQCYNAGNGNFPSNGSISLSGTYYFTGDVKINGSPTISGTATLIFFGSATLTITGSPIIQLTAMTSPAGPTALASVANLMIDLLIYDGEAAKKNQTVNISGSSASYFNGTVYVPNAPVTYAGNSGSTGPDPGCYQVIAYAVNFIGNTKLDNSKCISDSAVTPNIQTVRLVQ
jgi:hypothetical protein